MNRREIHRLRQLLGVPPDVDIPEDVPAHVALAVLRTYSMPEPTSYQEMKNLSDSELDAWHVRWEGYSGKLPTEYARGLSDRELTQKIGELRARLGFLPDDTADADEYNYTPRTDKLISPAELLRRALEEPYPRRREPWQQD